MGISCKLRKKNVGRFHIYVVKEKDYIIIKFKVSVAKLFKIVAVQTMESDWSDGFQENWRGRVSYRVSENYS